jgi:hypothetical protein
MPRGMQLAKDKAAAAGAQPAGGKRTRSLNAPPAAALPPS